MHRVLALQFGNVYQRRYPGYALLSRLYTNPCYCWLDPVNEGAGLKIRDARNEGYVHGSAPATLCLGLPDGDYEVTLTAFTHDAGCGPYAVSVNGTCVLPEVRLRIGRTVRHTFRARAHRNQVNLKFSPQAGREFLVNTIEVRSRRAVTLRPVFRSAPPAVMPAQRTLHRGHAPDPARELGRICDWLLAHRQPDGFLGDTYAAGGGYWYTASMPARALLAGHQLLGRREYWQAAIKTLDVFVDEQLPNGAWTASLRGRPTRSMPRREVAAIMAGKRQPLSDIGSVVSTLAIATASVTGARQKRYLAALRRFCDDWAPQFQQRDGGFSDGFWPPYTAIYSCATAIEAAAFSLTYRVTGEARYLDIATRAIRFLLNDWRTDGLMLGRAPHWLVHNRQPFVLEPLHFGDQWYYDEGFITTWHHARDPDFRTRVSRALHHRVHGRAGLLAALDGSTWWPIQDIWDNAKSIGMVQTLLFAANQDDRSPQLASALNDLCRLVATPEYSRRLGVMASDTGRPVAQHGLRCWAAMRMEATGFAGMTLAEMIRPGILYLA
ncbi:MAG: hypothetical protein IPN11_00835 [Opitutaceae bacterium]|nr:hypothetical protein [Opitutaceae bacterium]